jgi:serine/threonine protein kinase
MSDAAVANLLSFAQVLKTARRGRGLNQRELCKKLGIPVLVLSKLERAELHPDAQLLASLAQELALPASAIAAISALEATSIRQSSFVDDAETTLAKTRVRHVGLEQSQPSTLQMRASLLGQQIRGYEFIEQIGEGGFGAVYRARQLSVGRDVAIKVVKPELADDADFVRRFEAEAELVARLEHPHIVPLYDFWREPGAAFMVMRLLKGGALSQYLKTTHSPRFAVRVLPLLHQVAQALNAAHRAGVVHRDFKPANILLDEQGNACLADFGVAKQLHMDSGRSDFGEVVGSIAYCAPEQLRASEVSAATDVYALGLVAFELITGRRPFVSSVAATLINQHLNETPPMVSEFVSDIPTPVDAVIARALAKEVSARQQDALSFAGDLEAAFRGTESSWMGGAKIAIGDVATPTSSTFLQFSDADNPYLGLASFDEGDARNFFGREALIEQLLEQLMPLPLAAEPEVRAPELSGQHGWQLNRALVVVGASGSGKSSVVRAGLVPALRTGAVPGSKQWLITTLVPGVDPYANLSAALKRVAVRDTDVLAMLKADSFGLARAIDRCLPNEAGCELLLVLDQFEELFTLCSDDAARLSFIALLTTALLDPHARLRVIFTLRADFLDRPLQYSDLAEVLRERTVLVPAMSLDELERAIVGPARRVGLVFEEGLVAAILDEVKDQLGALPLLQYSLSELFLKRRDRELNLAAFRAMGGVRGALAGRAERIFAGLDADAQSVTRQVFLRLTTLGEGREDTRRRALQSEIAALHQGRATRAPAQLNLVLEQFAKARLLTFDRDAISHESTIELAHEALLRVWERLRDWLNTSRADLRLQRQLADAELLWRSNKADPSFFLSGNRLAQFRPLLQQEDVSLTAGETDFLTRSISAQDALVLQEQARQTRELAQAQALAEQEKRAAELAQTAVETQRRGNQRLRFLATGLAIILAFALWQSYQLNARSQALALETARANVEAKSAGALSDFWQDLFATADPNRSKGKDLSVREVLDVGVGQLEVKLADAPAARAHLLLTIAKTYRQLSALDAAAQAIASADRALATLDLTTTSALRIEVAQEQARVHADIGEVPAALAAIDRAKALEAQFAAAPLVRATTLNIEASVLNQGENRAQAIVLLKQALLMRKQNGAAKEDIARTLNNLAFALERAGKLGEANQLFSEAYALRLAESGPKNIDTALTLLNLARSQRDLGYFADADKAFATVLSTLNELFPDPSHPHPASAVAQSDFAISLRMQKRFDEALLQLDQICANSRCDDGLEVTILRERAANLLAGGNATRADTVIQEAMRKAIVKTGLGFARLQWRAAQIQHKLGQTTQAVALLEAALPKYESSGIFAAEYAEALLLMAELKPEQAAIRKQRANVVLQVAKEYWAAQQLLAGSEKL